MGNFLMPNKANVIGTVLLLAANWAGGFVSRYAVRLVAAGGADATGSAAGFAGRLAGGAAGAAGGAGAAQFANGGFALMSGAVTTLILAVLFYAAISIVVGKLVEKEVKKTAS